MQNPNSHSNPYLSAPIGALFARTALPMILVMVVNGLFSVVDAFFLGIYAGADALTAVTLTFPISMLMIALVTMSGSGMASLVARALGAGERMRAQAVFISAHSLALGFSVALALIFALIGSKAIELTADHHASLAAQGWRFMAITIYCSPITFFLSLQGDALRSEGRAGFMAILAVAATLLNIAFNYVLIGLMGYGPAGSAAGTVAAQALALAVVIAFRASGRLPLSFAIPAGLRPSEYWGPIVRLGLPPSLSFAGIALGSAAIIASVQAWAGAHYADTIAAYGIVVRIMSFAFLPLLGLNLAAQSIAGNNYGAGLYARSDRTAIFALSAALIYGVVLEAGLALFPATIGGWFINNPAVVAEIARILPSVVLTYVIFAPMNVLAGYFQALGQASIAGMLSLAKPYLLMIPLVVALPLTIGETGIWLAGPTGDLIMLAVAAWTLQRAGRRSGARLGMFYAAKPA
jgi:putative MATE family efflux protein